jgi:hypothetical protein
MTRFGVSCLFGTPWTGTFAHSHIYEACEGGATSPCYKNLASRSQTTRRRLSTTAWEMPNKTYTVFLAIVLNGETIRKLCRAPADFNSRECVNDKDGQVEHQIWDTSAAAWRNQ